MSGARGVGIAVLGVAFGACVACVDAALEPESPAGVHEGPVRSFDFVAPSGLRFSSETTRGRFTIVVVLTTYDLLSQYEAREVADLVRAHRPRLNAGAIAMEPPGNAPLVETFATSLGLPYAVALADSAHFAEDGAFGPIRGVPTVFVLDPAGREIWRKDGPASAAELERVLARVPSSGVPRAR